MSEATKPSRLEQVREEIRERRRAMLALGLRLDCKTPLTRGDPRLEDLRTVVLFERMRWEQRLLGVSGSICVERAEDVVVAEESLAGWQLAVDALEMLIESYFEKGERP